MTDCELQIFANYSQYEAMSTNEQLRAELERAEANDIKRKLALLRPRDEEKQPGSDSSKNQRNGNFKWSETTMTSYLKTAHMWNKDENGNVMGRCIHQGCDVHCAADSIPINCVGNNKYKVEKGIITSENKNGTGVYTRKVL